jgi:hypothetical protein
VLLPNDKLSNITLNLFNFNQMKSNKEQIADLVKEMLNESHEAMIKKIDKVLNSGCVDVENWSKDHSPMILPKCIVTAILQNESTQYECKGTSFEKQIQKEVKNIR